jgi:S1-C subfamily serine protease
VRRLSAQLLLLCACVTSRGAPRTSSSGDEPERQLSALREAGTSIGASRVAQTGGAKGDLREVYRKAAPATVIVRAGASYGSGVVFDTRGFVLTNHHVIARAELVDLKARVQLQRETISPQGVMVLDERPMTAWVLKSDPLLDLAVLKIADPPADLVAVKLSKRDPTPGEPVAALGHGGIGLLWAIKDGEVASVGKLATHLASLVGTDCVVDSNVEASAACRSVGASVELERQRLEEKVPGLVVQSSCQISPGDSGGPLVNLSAELVGVNAFLKTDPRAGVATNFHVHVAEVRRFLEAVPEQPEPRLPSAWDLVASGGAWADSDGDGKDDVYQSGSGARAAFIVNTSQQPVPPGLPMRLRPDAVLGQVDGQWIGWFDRDADGTFDRVVIAALRGGIGKALAFNGRTPGAFLGAASLTDPDLLPSPRWAALARELAPVLDSSTLLEPPEPLAGAKDFKARDLDGDGKPDAVFAQRGMGSAVFIDATAEVLSKTVAVEPSLRAATPALRVVRQPGRWWIFLGATRILESTNFVTVERAFLRSGSGALVAEPALRGTDWRAVTLSSFTGLARERAGQALATFTLYRPDRPLATFPVFGAAKGKISALSGPGLPLAIVTATEFQATTMGFALDATTGPTLATRTDWAQRGFPGAGFLWSSFEGVEWFQYDTDGDGQIDAVILKRGAVLEGRRIMKDGSVVEAADLSKGAPLQPALLKDATRSARLRALALEAFAPELIEP